MEQQHSDSELLGQVTRLLDTGDYTALLRAVDAAWPELGQREATIAIAEICRYAMLASLKAVLPLKAAVWRMRAWNRSHEAGWGSGIAALIMSEALRVQAIANDDRPPSSPEYVLYDEALEILEEMRPYMGDAGPQGVIRLCPRWVTRQYYEKRAFLLTTAGRWPEALATFEQAELHIADDVRGSVKVTLNKHAARYLSTDDDGVRAAAREATRELAAEAERIGQTELAEIAHRNVDLMGTRAAELSPYEIL